MTRKDCSADWSIIRSLATPEYSVIVFTGAVSASSDKGTEIMTAKMEEIYFVFYPLELHIHTQYGWAVQSSLVNIQ